MMVKILLADGSFEVFACDEKITLMQHKLTVKGWQMPLAINLHQPIPIPIVSLFPTKQRETMNCGESAPTTLFPRTYKRIFM